MTWPKEPERHSKAAKLGWKRRTGRELNANILWLIGIAGLTLILHYTGFI